jgi:glucose-6-phosphate-specific signal transduction histidine kinase
MGAVTDDGVGFDPSAKGYGTGTQAMAYRLAPRRGELRMTSAPTAGTNRHRVGPCCKRSRPATLRD